MCGRSSHNPPPPETDQVRDNPIVSLTLLQYYHLRHKSVDSYLVRFAACKTGFGDGLHTTMQLKTGSIRVWKLSAAKCLLLILAGLVLILGLSDSRPEMDTVVSCPLGDDDYPLPWGTCDHLCCLGNGYTIPQGDRGFASDRTMINTVHLDLFGRLILDIWHDALPVCSRQCFLPWIISGV